MSTFRQGGWGCSEAFLQASAEHHGGEPRKIVTDKLRSYGVAHRELMPEAIRSTE